MSFTHDIGINIYGNDVSASSAMSNFATNVENSAGRVDKASERTKVSLKKAVEGVSALAVSAYSLYLSYDRVVDMSMQVEKANLSVKRADEQLDLAQKSLNSAIEKYGYDSAEAKDAADKLSIAQDTLAVANERAEQTQENQSQAMTSFYLGLVPQAITMVAGIGAVYTSLTGKKLMDIVATEGLTASTIAHGIATKASATYQWLLNAAMSANPIGIIVLALAALTAGLIWAYQNCEWFREGINAIGTAIYNYFKPAIDGVTWAINNLGAVWDAILSGMRWVWDRTIAPILDALGWVWNTLTGAATWATGGGGTTGEGIETENIPTFATGGIMPHTGLAFLHEGEVIIPPNTTQLIGHSGGSATVISGPLVYIEGSADEKTARLASSIILREIRRY